MLIDCDTCQVRDLACGDCLVTALLPSARGQLDLDESHQRAFDVLADGGLVPRLQLTALGSAAANQRRRAAG